MTLIPDRAGPARPLSRLALLLLAAAIVVGCATPRPDPEPAPDPEVRPDLAELPPEVRASLLLSEARSRPEPETVRSAIEAVLALDAPTPDQLDQADNLWTQLPDAERESQATRILGARVSAARDDWERARERLGVDDPDDPTRTPEVFRQGLTLHARLLEREGQWYQALDTRLRLDGLLVMEPDTHNENQQRIWGLLAALRPAQREQVLGNHPPDGDAWVSLFRLLRAAETDEEARRAAGQWRERHPSHPANSLLPDLIASHPLRADASGDTLVLLPLSGDLAELGNAILDGITRAHYAEGGQGRLIVRDTRGEPEGAAALYRRGVESGVARIIGPLRRESVAQVTHNDRFSPTVLLNRAESPVDAPLTTLALNPEEDARAVVDRADRAGWHHALVILPEGSFGDRVASAYRAALAEQDRRPREIIRVQPTGGELNAAIGNALGIEQSEARIRDVVRRTGLTLEADPQVRADVDHLFISGTPSQVRRIVPHVHFHRAGHLPMMATAHVYTGNPNADRDGDLNGIVFPDAPWLFDRVSPIGDDNGTPDASTLPRFVALGMDAMRLSLRQEAVRSAPHHQLNGGAGTWGLNPFDGQWVREPAWARFERGEPRRIDVLGGES